jgi:putative ABC transport system permease protein
VSIPVFLKLALRGLARNRRRSVITLAAIAIGLAGLVFLWAYVDGMNRQMVGNITSYLTGHVQLHARGYHDDPTLDLAFDEPSRLSSALATQPLIAATAPRVEGEALASGPDKTRGVLVIGVNPQSEQAITTLSKTVFDGSYLSAADPKGIVLGEQVAKVLQVGIAGEVTLVTQASDGSIGAGRYRVRGLYRTGIDLIDGAYIFMTLPAAQDLYSLGDRVTTVTLRLRDIDTTSGFVASLKHDAGDDFEVLGWQELMPSLADNVALHRLFAYIILAVVFVVITLGLANTILMGVMERIREFGVMMALGTDARQIQRIVLYEALLLGAAGVGLGSTLGAAVVGYLGARGMHLEQYAEAVQTMPGLTGTVYPHISVTQLLILSALLLATTVLASLYPAWKAARFTPIEAIRGIPTSSKARRLKPRRAVMPLPARAVLVRVALRNLVRNPRRALLTFAALGAGFAAYLFLGALIRGFFVQMRDNATDLLAGHVQIEVNGFRDDFDPKLTLTDPEVLLQRARANPLVKAATPRLQAMTMVSSPTQTEPVMLYGVDPENERNVTRLHEALREGHTLSVAMPREILIGRSLANRLGVRLGEKIVVMAQAADGTLGSAALRVGGIYETGNEVLDRNTALTTLGAARELLGTQAVSTIVMRVADSAHVATAAAQLAPALTSPNQRVVTWKELLPQVVQMLDLSTVDLYVVLIVVFAVVALGVTNTMLMAVLERTREFGLQLALGTRPEQVVRTVLYESLVLGVIGLGLGLLLGAAIVAYYRAVGFDLSAYAAIVKSIPGMTGVVYPIITAGDVWIPMLALLITSLAAALYPAWRAARLDAIQALRRV